ncbi:universal stress protein [Blastococcus sp. TF02-09]|uniref:universal stress protein n=1 Tax=Blastococcus sp. TF02-09 TaxID=2250576 RepID=UPI000DE8D9E1|nr:universal stress protein [Blastococcus sp. TF02-9]RBY79411.1 universal stress protein [Blastococcus sp. TF02-9]
MTDRDADESPERLGPVPRGTGPVVVGIDGSDSSSAAARWAAAEATRRHVPLHVIHVVPPPPGAFPTDLAWAAIDWQARSQPLLDATTDFLHQLHPALEVRSGVLVGRPTAAALNSEAEFAELLVIGSRGRGGFATLLLGSTAVQVLETLAAPVVVVGPMAARDETAESGPVVVGVDGSAGSQRALRFAANEATLRGTTVTAVYAWEPAPHPGLDALRAASGLDWSSLAQHATDLLDDELTRVRTEFPHVQFTGQTLADQPVQGLVDASQDAQLLVVGSRGRGALGGLVMGSVSHSVVRAAHCPVAVLR